MGTALVAIPIGVEGTIYLAEYVRDTCMSRCIRLAIVNLAGIPSIVYGLFGLGMFVLYLKMGTSIVAGALTLAIMILPVIIGRAEEALRAVPTEFRTVPSSFSSILSAHHPWHSKSECCMQNFCCMQHFFSANYLRQRGSPRVLKFY